MHVLIVDDQQSARLMLRRVVEDLGADLTVEDYADPVEGVDAYGKAITPTSLVDITEVMETKREMLRAHASQREWLMKHHGLDEYVRGMEAWAAKVGAEALDLSMTHGREIAAAVCVASR